MKVKVCSYHPDSRASHISVFDRPAHLLCMQCALERLARGEIVTRLDTGAKIKAKINTSEPQFEKWEILTA